MESGKAGAAESLLMFLHDDDESDKRLPNLNLGIKGL